MDAPPARIELSPTPASVAVARQFVSEHGSGLDLDLMEDAQLLVAELVTNAIKHGRPAITLRVCSLDSGIGVEVQDQGTDEPVMPIGRRTREQRSGRGLRMVATVASDWGYAVLKSVPARSSGSRCGR